MVDPKKLKYQMQLRFIDGKTLAKMSGLSDTSIYLILQGKQQPRTSTLKAICEALGCTAADVLKEI